MKKTIQTAPLLSRGQRVRLYGRLPEPVKEGLRAIARMEGKSMSWVVEEVIIRYFKMRTPAYKNVLRTTTGRLVVRKKAA